MESAKQKKRERIITALAKLPRDSVIYEAGMEHIFSRCSKSIRRAVGRGELPRPIKQFGQRAWTVGVVLDHMNKRLEAAQREAERLERRICEHRA